MSVAPSAGAALRQVTGQLLQLVPPVPLAPAPAPAPALMLAVVPEETAGDEPAQSQPSAPATAVVTGPLAEPPHEPVTHEHEQSPGSDESAGDPASDPTPEPVPTDTELAEAEAATVLPGDPMVERAAEQMPDPVSDPVSDPVPDRVGVADVAEWIGRLCLLEAEPLSVTVTAATRQVSVHLATAAAFDAWRLYLPPGRVMWNRDDLRGWWVTNDVHTGDWTLTTMISGRQAEVWLLRMQAQPEPQPESQPEPEAVR